MRLHRYRCDVCSGDFEWEPELEPDFTQSAAHGMSQRGRGAIGLHWEAGAGGEEIVSVMPPDAHTHVCGLCAKQLRSMFRKLEGKDG